MNLGLRIKTLRKQHKMSQVELAQKMNLSQSAIANYESNSRMPQIDQLLEMASLFNVSIDELVQANKTDIKNYEGSQIDWVMLSDRFVRLLLDRKAEEAKALVMDLIDHDVELDYIYMKLMRYTMTKIGWLWEVGEISTPEEHRLSYEVERISVEVLLATKGQGNKNQSQMSNEQFIGVLAPGEKHTFALKTLMWLLDYHGVKSDYIGESVPFSDLKAYILEVKPTRIMFHLTMPYYLEAVLEQIEVIRSFYDCIFYVVGPGTNGQNDKLESRQIRTYKTFLKDMEVKV